MLCNYNYTPADAARFFSHVEKSETIWLWAASKNKQGYGFFGLKRKILRAHRFAYFLYHGPFPDELDVCHTCDSPSCVMPQHLFLATRKGNMQDAAMKGRTTQGEKDASAKLTATQVIEIRQRWELGETQASLGIEYGVHSMAINCIVRRKSWRHLGGGIANIPTPSKRRGMKLKILNEDQVRDIRARVENGEMQKRLAEEYGVSKGAVQSIVKRRTWKHID